jgi:hypothetical protein
MIDVCSVLLTWLCLAPVLPICHTCVASPPPPPRVYVACMLPTRASGVQ